MQNERDQYSFLFRISDPNNALTSEQIEALKEFRETFCWAPLMLMSSRVKLRAMISSGDFESVSTAVRKFLEDDQTSERGVATKVGLFLDARPNIGEEIWLTFKRKLENLIAHVFKDTRVTSF